ncbi:hypothetical protein EJB05_28132, partial [Eragrostis curvula]
MSAPVLGAGPRILDPSSPTMPSSPRITSSPSTLSVAIAYPIALCARRRSSNPHRLQGREGVTDPSSMCHSSSAPQEQEEGSAELGLGCLKRTGTEFYSTGEDNGNGGGRHAAEERRHAQRWGHIVQVPTNSGMTSFTARVEDIYPDAVSKLTVQHLAFCHLQDVIHRSEARVLHGPSSKTCPLLITMKSKGIPYFSVGHEWTRGVEVRKTPSHALMDALLLIVVMQSWAKE